MSYEGYLGKVIELVADALFGNPAEPRRPQYQAGKDEPCDRRQGKQFGDMGEKHACGKQDCQAQGDVNHDMLRAGC